MGKNKNKNTQSAAEAAAAQQQAPEVKDGENKTQNPTNKVEVIQLADIAKYAELSKTGGMDHNHIMDMIRVQHETFRMDLKAVEHTGMSKEAIEKINRINAIEQVALMASVVTYDNTPFAITMRAGQLEAIKEAASALGIPIDMKALPTPNEDGTVNVPSSAIKVSPEKKKEIKKENEAGEKQVILDPTKIESEDQLKDSLLKILVKGNGSDNFYSKVSTAINFYESYLGIQANKAENREEALNELKNKSRADLFSEIAKLLGKCTFTIGGMAKFMFEQTERTKNPVVAFCTFRNASLSEKTGMPQIEDQLVADIVKVLHRWYADSEIEETNRIIKGFEDSIKVLEEDKKKNAKGIKDGQDKIAHAKARIQHIEEVVSYANIPSRDIIDAFEEDYADSSKEGYKYARMMGAKIMDTYYPGVKAKEMDQESLIYNLKQYVGVIFNMFLPAMQKLVDFSEANITELKKAEEAPAEEKN